jgi:hypothetical protein
MNSPVNMTDPDGRSTPSFNGMISTRVCQLLILIASASCCHYIYGSPKWRVEYLDGQAGMTMATVASELAAADGAVVDESAQAVEDVIDDTPERIPRPRTASVLRQMSWTSRCCTRPFVGHFRGGECRNACVRSSSRK